jgi:hypothetical protein
MEKELFKCDTESNIIYNYRKNFIETYTKNNTDDINTIIKYSKMLANMKFKGCSYDDTIYHKLKAFL